MTEKSKLFFLLTLKAVLLLALIISGWIPLAPDEAQYWTWSQKLDWGYYSKPPGIAWQIKITTLLFGNTELGIRFGSILFGFLLAYVLYKLASRLGLSERGSFWSAVAFAFSPLGVYLSFASTTDPGAIVFFTLGILAIVCGPNYILAGVCVMLGALFKWTAFALWPFVFLALFFFPHMRKKRLILGVLISLLALLPTLYWNISHDFATFKHVAATGSKRGGGNFFDFLGAQIGLLSPVFFLLLLAALVKIYREKRDIFLFVASIPSAALLYLLYSLFAKVQPNWAAYLYPPGFALIAWYAYKHYQKWLYIGLWISIFLSVALFSTRFVPIPYKMNPLRQNLGWEKLYSSLHQAGFEEDKDFLFADKYQMTSLLSFYVSKKSYFFNLNQRRKNQFSYWEQMSPLQIGRTGYFAVAENVPQSSLEWYEKHYMEALEPYFEKVEYCGAYPIFVVSGIPVKHLFLFKGISYNGKLPDNPEKY